MGTYFLRSRRLGFRTWTAADRDLAVGLWCDPAVTRWFGGPFDEEWAVRRLAAEMAHQETHGYQYWPLFRLDDGTHVGCCGLHPREPAARIGSFGFHLRREHWGRGYATEAARTAIRFAFEVLDVRSLFAGHHPRNLASRHVLDKLGFHYTHDELYPPTGLQHRSYLLDATAPAREPS